MPPNSEDGCSDDEELMIRPAFRVTGSAMRTALTISNLPVT